MQTFRTRLFSVVMRLSRSQKRMALLAVDACLASLALLASVSIVYQGQLTADAAEGLALLLALAGGVSVAASACFGLQKVKLNAYEAWAILRTGAVALATALALAPAMTWIFPPVGLVLFGMLHFLLMVGARFAMLHILLWVLRLGQPRRRVLIYGAGNTGIQLAAALRSHESIVAVAFVDDNASLQGMSVGGLRIYGGDRIARLVRDLEVDRVLLAMPSVSAPKMARIARRLEGMGLAVMAVPSFAQLIGEEALIDTLTPVVPGRFLNRPPVDDAVEPGSAAYHDRVVMVTGAGGTVGSELCRQVLSHRPRRLVLFEVSEIALYTIDRELRELAEGTGIEIQPVLGTVTDARLTRSAMIDGEVEVVLHAAAYKHVPLVEGNPVAGLANNVLGTRILAEAAVEAGVGRFVLISTDKAVRPTNIMGASKRMAEIVVQDIAGRAPRTSFSMVRFGNVLGSSGSVIPLFKEQIARGGPVTLTHEDVTRYFMTITEAARLVLIAGALSDQPRHVDLYVLDMGRPVLIRDLAVQMIEAAGCTLRDAENPAGDIEIVVTGLRPGEKLHEELLIGTGLFATPHAKILRADEGGLTELQVAGMLRSIRTAVGAGDGFAARRVVEDHLALISGEPDAAAGIAAQ